MRLIHNASKFGDESSEIHVEEHEERRAFALCGFQQRTSSSRSGHG